MSREVKIVECESCRREIRVEIVMGPLDSGGLKCPSCKALESGKSAERLIRVIFNS